MAMEGNGWEVDGGWFGRDMRNNGAGMDGNGNLVTTNNKNNSNNKKQSKAIKSKSQET